VTALETPVQGCQMVYLHTKSRRILVVFEGLGIENFGNSAFLQVFGILMYILRSFLYILSRFSMLCQEKSGNLAQKAITLVKVKLHRHFFAY
jgi:hypothetical protein